jgi:uncharacterized membrane protein YfcA
VAAAINSGAGGGSFVSFPTLVFLGVPPISANATNSVAMWIGGAGSIGAYRDMLGSPTRRLLIMLAVCVLGGAAGALLLLHTPQHAFDVIVPWLLLFATVLFACGPILKKLRERDRAKGEDLTEPPIFALLPVFVVAVYGGYFGGGQGFLLLAMFALVGIANVQRANALKIVFSFVNNGVSTIPFVVAGVLEWDVAAVMCVSAVLGGYYGGKVVRKLPGEPLRWGIVTLGIVLTVLFFVRAHYATA